MISRNIRTSILMTLLFGSTLPTSARAQSATQATGIARSIVNQATDGAKLAPVGVTNKSVTLAPVNLPAQRSTYQNVGSNRAMMGVGVVALVVGLIIGGDVGTLIAVGGAVLGLLGLYRYMQ